MTPNRNYLQRVLRSAVFLLATLLFFRFLFVPLLPFLLSLGLSALLEPLVQKLRHAFGIRRAFAAVALTTVFLMILGSTTTFLTLKLSAELTAWSTRLPQAINTFPVLWNCALDRMEGWYVSCPSTLRSILDALASSLSESTPAIVGKAGSILMEKISSFAALLPSVGLFCITTTLALYFTAANYTLILAFIKRQLPLSWQPRCHAAAQCCRGAILKWFRSELILIAVTFFIMLLGFWWFGYDYALLAASAIALVDALPVLGSGTILIPWAIFSFLLSDAEKGLFLLSLYAVALLVHSLLEPRLLAGQANLPSIAVLLTMYLGFHFLGVGGMLLFPIFLIIIKHLQDADVLHLWHS